jgi:hypothetical protein
MCVIALLVKNKKPNRFKLHTFYANNINRLMELSGAERKRKVSVLGFSFEFVLDNNYIRMISYITLSLPFCFPF